jgi:hypothetical protein
MSDYSASFGSRLSCLPLRRARRSPFTRRIQTRRPVGLWPKSVLPWREITGKTRFQTVAQVSESQVSESQVSEPQVSEPQASVPQEAVRNDTPALPPPHRRTSEPAASSGFPKWIIVGAAGVVFVILGLHWRGPADVATQPQATSASLPVETAAPPPLTKTASPKPTVRTAPKPSPAAGQEIWRVIAFTYHTRDAAAKKAQQLNEYHPGIHADVFVPKDNRGYYLVSLGGRMTREEAERLQRSARGKGLPRDLYVQNYSR